MNGTIVAPTMIQCNHTESEMDIFLFVAYEKITFWMEFVVQSIIGIAGILANTVAIPVLYSMDIDYGIFNRLLIFLAAFDNFFIVCQILEAKRKMNNFFEGYFQFDQIHEYAFGYFLYPFHAFLLTSSIYINLALALERYRAVWRPVEYHNKYKGINPWKRMMQSYVVPVVVFSLVFSIPKCFEIKMEKQPGLTAYDLKSNASISNNASRYESIPTKFRMNDIYVLVYSNIARITVQDIIPFLSLIFLNYRIYWVLKRRKELKNRPGNGSSMDTGNGTKKLTDSQRRRQHSVAAAHLLNVNANEGHKTRASFSAERKENETKHAAILFFIVLLFFVCHTPRTIINIHEFINLDLLRRGMENNCETYPVLAFIFTSVSNCLLTLKASSNFYIYCIMCAKFRSVLYDWILTVCAFLRCKLRCCCKLHCDGKSDNNDAVSEEIYETEENRKMLGETVSNENSTECVQRDKTIPKITFTNPDKIVVVNDAYSS